MRRRIKMSRCSKCGGDGAAVEGGYCKPCKAAYAKERARRLAEPVECSRCGQPMERWTYNWCPECVEANKRGIAEARKAVEPARKEYHRAYHERNKEAINARSLDYYYKVTKPNRIRLRAAAERREGVIVTVKQDIVNP